MSVIVGVVIGYLVGSRSPERRSELRGSLRTLSESEEARAFVASGILTVGGLVQRGAEIVASRLQASEGRASLRRVG